MKESIVVNNISKKYRVGVKKEYDTLVSKIIDVIFYPFRNFKQISSLSKIKDNDASVFWALKNISFNVKEGEVLGIIGKNGAGKSTLLKVLSKITEPNQGFVKIKGRVSSLLEVGTGFHPELTGRDNIYMNGTILGMTKKEVSSKFDSIVSFSGIEHHIDTPVKFYSSGMMVRLAFSVAAHLEPDILIVDEVLAVGDAEFQKKCIGRMNEVSKSGRTVLFVSHDLTAISQLCSRCIVMNKGQVYYDGAVDNALNAYNKLWDENRTSKIVFSENAPENENFKLIGIEAKCDTSNILSINSDIIIDISLLVKISLKNTHPVLTIKNDKGLILFTTSDYLFNSEGIIGKGYRNIKCIIPAYTLSNKTYFVDLGFYKNARYELLRINDIISINPLDDGKMLGGYVGDWHGEMRPLCNWSIE